MSKLVCIKTYSNRAAAELAKNVLETHGIRASVSGDEAVGILGTLAGSSKLFVMDENAERALVVLERADRDG